MLYKVSDILEISNRKGEEKSKKMLGKKDISKEIERLIKEMQSAAKMLEFEHAAMIRDLIQNYLKIEC